MRFAATLIAMAVGTAASAQGFGEGAWYAKAFGGVTLPGDELTTVDGLIWAFAKEPRRIIWPGPPGMDLDYDAGTTLGAAVGLAVMPRLGVELEYAHRGADLQGSFYDDAGVNSVMLNSQYRFDGIGPAAALRPYLGAGLGWASVDISTSYLGDFSRNDALAYQLIGGVEYALSPKWSLLGELRWFATDSGRIDGQRGLSIDAGFNTVDVLVGAGYRF